MSGLLRSVRAWWRSILPPRLFDEEPPAWINTASARQAWKLAKQDRRQGIPVKWESE